MNPEVSIVKSTMIDDSLPGIRYGALVRINEIGEFLVWVSFCPQVRLDIPDTKVIFPETFDLTSDLRRKITELVIADYSEKSDLHREIHNALEDRYGVCFCKLDISTSSLNNDSQPVTQQDAF